MIWKLLLHALRCTLQKNSGSKVDWETILRIQWRTCPICHLPIGHDHLEGLQDPYVTFLSADQLREHHTIFMAEEFDVVNGPNR